MRNFISTIALASAALACSSTEETPQRGQMQASSPTPPIQHEQEVRSAEGILELAAEEGEMLVEPQEPTEDGKEELASVGDPPGSPQYFIEVRPGENLITLSDWAKTTPTELATLNGMEVQDTLFAGQKLGLELSGEEVDGFVEARDRALDARVDRYLDRRGGLYTVESHAMRQGETAWGVGQDKGEIPLWVLAAFNQDVELSSLSIGDLLSVPVVEDTIQASAEADHGPSAEIELIPVSGEGSF